MLLLRGLIGFAIVVGLFVFLARRYWRGRHRIAASLGIARRHPAPAAPRSPIDPRSLFDHVRIERVGELDVPTGSLVMCDPLVFPDDGPFERTIAPGRYPVDVAVVDIGPDHQRVAAMRVVLGTGTPATSEPAGSFGVDAGVGCVMDVAAQKLVIAERDRLAFDTTVDEDDDVLLNELDDRDWAVHVPVAGRSENVILAHSGWGDGIYDCYWVLDGSGAPLWLVADFNVQREDLATARVVGKGEAGHRLPV